MVTTEPTRRTQVVERVLTVVTITALIGAIGMMVLPNFSSLADPVPRPRVASGTDTIIAILVSANCDACSEEETVNRIAEAIDQIIHNRSRQSRTRLLGVAVDLEPSAGYTLLRKLGSFDELSVGGGWGNLAVTQLIWDDSLGTAAVPQVVMLERGFNVDDTGYHQIYRAITPLALGANRVIDWLADYSQGQAP